VLILRGRGALGGHGGQTLIHATHSPSRYYGMGLLPLKEKIEKIDFSKFYHDIRCQVDFSLYPKKIDLDFQSQGL
jgi:hypothetical protein